MLKTNSSGFAPKLSLLALAVSVFVPVLADESKVERIQVTGSLIKRVQQENATPLLQVTAEDDAKDFEFIIDIESKMALVMRQLGRIEEADEVERRLASVRDALN